MSSDKPFVRFPPRPASVEEWENLLVRFEIGPGALRALAAEIPTERWAIPLAPGKWSARDQVAHLAENEMRAAQWFSALREGGRFERGEHLDPPGGPPEPGEEVRAEIDRHIRRFADARARNFAVVQRRGLEVWDWTAQLPEGEPVTAFQVVSQLVSHDGHHFARIRQTRSAEDARC